NAFRTRSVVTHVAKRVHMRPDVIAQHNQVMRGQPVDSVFGSANTFGELLPRLKHCHGRTNDTGKRHHVVMHRHAQVDQSSSHIVSFPEYVIRVISQSPHRSPAAARPPPAASSNR